jgi:hypothetical protein
MNALDQQIAEVAVKIDNEDLGVVLFALNLWGNQFSPRRVEDKIKLHSMRKLRQKLEIRHLQTKGSTKEFRIRIEPVQAYALMIILNSVSGQISQQSYEANVCRKLSNDFHQKLTGL